MPTDFEAKRLQSLQSYSVMDTLPEAAFDRLTSLAAELFETPIAVVSLIDDKRAWFKSRHGVEATSILRECAFCAHAIQQDPGSILVVEDALQDPRFMANPMVTSEPNIRFYAGAVLTSAEGYNLGTLCVIDRKPRPPLTAKERKRLATLAQLVMDELELRKARLEVHEKKAMLDLAEHMSGLGQWRFDIASGDISWSDEMFRIHGLEVGSVPPDFETMLALYHEQDRARLADLVQRAISQGEGYQLEARLRRRDGVERNISAKAQCVLDDFGATKALIGVFQDVTEHVQAAHFLQTITDNLPSQIAYWDKDLRYRFANSAYQARFGKSREELLGMTLPQALGEAHFQLNAPRVRAALRGERQAFERTLTKPTGEVEHLWANYIPDFDEAGAVRGVFVLGTDVTALKESELRLHETNALLAAARDRAEAAALVKSEFLANMSHEIRTPLTAIIGFTNLLKTRTEVASEARAQIAQVAKASEALLAIVNDILDFSKLEAGRVKIQPRPTAPSSLLSDTLSMFESIAGAKGLTLEIAEQSLPAAVRIDPDKTRQVLINLVGNAVKFTDQGSVRVSAAYDASAERLDVRVQDTGVGMTAEQQAALFQRFSQVDGSSTRRHGGTGLGLAICKGLVTAMGGDIGVCSVAGEGSVFHFQIAAPQIASPQIASPMSNAGWAGWGEIDWVGRPLDKLRVLVVDDNSSNRELARIFLERYGADVSEAHDGSAAVEQALTEPKDIILLDLRMPKLSGVEVLLKIRATEGPNRDVPVLAFTADGASDRQDEYEKFNGLVHKPLVPQALVATLLQSLECRRDARQSAA